MLLPYLFIVVYVTRYVQCKIDVTTFRCSKDFCRGIICEDGLDCIDGKILPKGSYCGCCDTCVKTLNLGDPCQEDRSILDEIPQQECKQGLICLNGICAFNVSSSGCLRIEHHRKQRKKENRFPYTNDLWLPDCDQDGNFKAKQQKKRKSICLDESGKKIYGQEEQDLSKISKCGCSRHMQQLEQNNAAEFMTKPQEHCTDGGNFESLQCIGNICYCADNTTGVVIGRVAKMANLKLLPCYDNNIEANYLLQCEEQLRRSRSLKYEFHQKNIAIVELEFVNCDYDGTFAPKQCDSNRCVCTDDDGVGIKSYHPDRTREVEFFMKCNCARDEHDREAFHSRYPRMKCDVNGNFQHMQCFGVEHCYCVDEDGDVISEQRLNLTEEYCRLMLQNLNPDFVELTTVDVETTTDDDYSYSDYS